MKKIIKKLLNIIFRKKYEKLYRYKTDIQNFFGYGLYAKLVPGRPQLMELGITDVAIIKGALTITLERPGLLIGKHGLTIKELHKYIIDNNGPVEIRIIESTLWKYYRYT